MLLTPFFLAFSVFRQIKALQQSGYEFDAIDAHYYYPDGVSAAMVAKCFNKPLSITARGTDINLISDMTLPRKMILWASKVARYNLAVCQALRQRMLEIGVEAETTQVMRNGVNLQLFSPLERAALRQKYQVTGKLLISVGYLIERKGHHLIIEALVSLPDYQLFIAGAGEWEARLKNQAKELGVAHRVRFLGEVDQQQLPELYNCADALVLASSREGWANVLLEAMACGTPVVASNIWGTPEVVQAAEAGVLCQERTAAGIVEAVQRLFADYPDRSKTRRYAEGYSWDETTAGLLKLFKAINTSVNTQI
jgi:glycosyltransferase involved in cell wall biosynthesis